MDDQNQGLATLAAARLREILEEFTSELTRKPSSAELFEILTSGLLSLRDDALSDVHPSNIIALKPEFKKGASPKDAERGGGDSGVAELNDAVFAVADYSMADLANALRKHLRSVPKLKDLCELLVEGLHKCDDDLLADISAAHITGVKAVVKKKGKKITAKVGDIVAIPVKNGKYSIAVILAQNPFGVAYGFFKGTSDLEPVSMHSHPPVDPHPIYSGNAFLASGRWKIIGHDEELLSLFPREPEIYHYQHQDKPNPAIGPFGSGETASGRLRPLTKEEAEELGLQSLEYRQTYLPESLEEYLSARLKAQT